MTQRPADEFSEPDAEDNGLRPARDDAETPQPLSSRRRRPWAILVGATGIAALAVATGALLHAQERDRRTPEAAVLGYAQLIESGDVEAATDLVPVPGAPEPAELEPDPATDAADTDGGRPVTVEITVAPELLLEPDLLRNDSYASNPGLTDVAVELVDPGAGPAVGDVVEVRVAYEVQDRPATTVLRVERLPDAFPALPAYRVVDSLALPAVVEVLDGRLGEARIADVPVVVSSTVGSGDPQVATMLYPGEYPVSFDGGAHLEAPDATVRVAGPSSAQGADARPGTELVRCPEVYLTADGSRPPSFTGTFSSVDLSVYAPPRSPVTSGPVVQASLEGTVLVEGPDGAREEPVRVVVNLQPDDGEAPADVYAGIVLG